MKNMPAIEGSLSTILDASYWRNWGQRSNYIAINMIWNVQIISNILFEDMNIIEYQFFSQWWILIFHWFHTMPFDYKNYARQLSAKQKWISENFDCT